VYNILSVNHNWKLVSFKWRMVDMIDEEYEDPTINHFMEYFCNAMDFAYESSNAHNGIIISRDCYEIAVRTPLDILYLCIRNIIEVPGPNYLTMKNMTEEQKKQCMDDQIEFRKLWKSVFQDVTHKIEIIAHTDDHIEFKIKAYDGNLHYIMKKYSSVEEFNKEHPNNTFPL